VCAFEASHIIRGASLTLSVVIVKCQVQPLVAT